MWNTLRLSTSRICSILDQELLTRCREEERETGILLFPLLKVRMHLSPMPKPFPGIYSAKSKRADRQLYPENISQLANLLLKLVGTVACAKWEHAWWEYIVILLSCKRLPSTQSSILFTWLWWDSSCLSFWATFEADPALSERLDQRPPTDLFRPKPWNKSVHVFHTRFSMLQGLSFKISLCCKYNWRVFKLSCSILNLSFFPNPLPTPVPLFYFTRSWWHSLTTTSV